jgi:hypothetical protein
MQKYYSGEEIRLGDLVKWPNDEGKIVALEDGLSPWGFTLEEARGRAMIEFKKAGFVCEEPATAEDIVFVARAKP